MPVEAVVDRQPNHSEDYLLLKNTSIRVPAQVAMLVRDLTEGLNSGLNYSEVIDQWLVETRADTIAAKSEVLDQGVEQEGQVLGTVLVNDLAIAEVNGELKLVPTRYGDRQTPIDQMFDPDERRGAPLIGFRNLQRQLVRAQIGAVVVLVSPTGQIYDQLPDTPENQYPRAQVYAAQRVSESEVSAFTLIADLNWYQARQLQALLDPRYSYGFREKFRDLFRKPMDRIFSIATREAYISGERGLSIISLVDYLQKVQGGNNMVSFDIDGRVVRATHEMARHQLMKSLPEFLAIDQETENLIGNYESFVKNSQEVVVRALYDLIGQGFDPKAMSQQELRDFVTTHPVFRKLCLEYGRTITLMMHDIRVKNGEVEPGEITEETLKKEAEQVAKKNGCPITKAALTKAEIVAIAARYGISEEIARDPDFCINCGACGAFILAIVRRNQKCPECREIRIC